MKTLIAVETDTEVVLDLAREPEDVLPILRHFFSNADTVALDLAAELARTDGTEVVVIDGGGTTGTQRIAAVRCEEVTAAVLDAVTDHLPFFTDDEGDIVPVTPPPPPPPPPLAPVMRSVNREDED
jgi:hypothetical protein